MTTNSKDAPDMRAALEPCPNPWCESHTFDGGEPKTSEDIWRLDGNYRVQCPYCPIKGPHSHTEAGAIGAWNDRASTTSGEEIEDALSLYRALANVDPVYVVSGIRPSVDVPFNWYVLGPDGEVAYCQMPDGQQHADMIAAALNDRVAMCRLPANDRATPSPAQQSGEVQPSDHIASPEGEQRAREVLDQFWLTDSPSYGSLYQAAIRAMLAFASTPRAAVPEREDFLDQLRRVNTERYDAWAVEPVMLCVHCGRSREDAASVGADKCNPPFTVQAHAFEKPHPYLTRSNDAGIMFDALELGGEVGELLNVVKKLEREARGWRGSRATAQDFADECADVLICLDKLARRQGVDLIAATVAKFNATSEKQGFPHVLSLIRSEKSNG